MITKNLAASLKEFGIRAAPYKRPPVGDKIFALTIRPTHRQGVVTVHQGAARVEVFGDKTKRQAAVTVREKGRVVKQRHEYTQSKRTWKKPTEEEAKKVLVSKFSVLMPKNTAWTLTDYQASRYDSSEPWTVRGTITARVKNATINHFLIGMDETHHFVAPLPKKATSVDEAHAILRPGGISEKAKRQGEWFFDPVTNPATKKQLQDHIGIARKIRLEGRTHTAMTAINMTDPVTRKAAIYARGYIHDNRVGHHKPLFLTLWHKVVRNKEATIKINPEQRERAKRRQNTWD